MYQPEPINTDAIIMPDEIKELMEKIAENTHEVWSSQRLKDGWTYGTERNDQSRKHPGLVPYEELPESEKAYDRIISENVLKTVYAMGYEIRKKAGDSILEKAVAIAAGYHNGQMDKAGEVYLLHLLRVMLGLKHENEQVVAVLHDILEDTPCSVEKLTELGFSKEIIEAVIAITKRENEPYDTYLARVKNNPLARSVKLVDLEDNMRIDRLPEITEKDLERHEKYKKAQKFLKGE